MKRIVLLFLCINQSSVGAADKNEKCEYSRAYRDRRNLMVKIDNITRKPLCGLVEGVDKWIEPYGEGRYECLWPDCTLSLGRQGKGMAKSGINAHVESHLTSWKCKSCKCLFDRYGKCYRHIEKECKGALVNSVMNNGLGVKKGKDGPAQKVSVSTHKKLISLIQKGRKLKGKKRECLECSLSLGTFFSYASRESYQDHVETIEHQNIISTFLQRKPSKQCKELQLLHRQLNHELEDNLMKDKKQLEEIILNAE